MSRDWTKTLRPASFRGVPFYVEVEGLGGARRLSISPIAYAETSVIEDMGKEPDYAQLTAYVVGDQSDAAAIALQGALSASGPGRLVLPMAGGKFMRVTDWSWSRSKSRGGYVGFDVAFIEQGLGSVPFGAIAGAGAIGAMLSAGAALLSVALAFRFRDAGPVQVQTERAAAAASVVRYSAAAVRISGGADVSRTMAAAERSLVSTASGVAEDPAAYCQALVGGWRLLTIDGDAEAASAFLADEMLQAFDGATGAAELAVLSGALSLTAVRRDYPTRQDATRARDSLAASVDPAVRVAERLDAGMAEWLTDITGQAALTVSQIAADRAPLVRVETPISLSAITAAYRLYGDAKRAGDLIDRNGVTTAAFMPVVFEAESV